ncbi:hypothetical protein Q3304_12125 [Clostridioides sp. GD02377]|uniref:hypothetical protein n=1 Tax=unclassified Clostridioides TaxID=2635829 RepID=UPI0038B14747
MKLFLNREDLFLRNNTYKRIYGLTLLFSKWNKMGITVQIVEQGKEVIDNFYDWIQMN